MPRNRDTDQPFVDPETGEVLDTDPYSEETELVPMDTSDFERDLAVSTELPDLSSLLNADGAVELSALRKAVGLPTSHKAPKDVVDRPMQILKLKLVPSEKAGAGYFYVGLCRFVGDEEKFTCPLGGQVTLPILDMYAKMQDAPPLQVTLHYHEGGRFGGYYTMD